MKRWSTILAAVVVCNSLLARVPQYNCGTSVSVERVYDSFPAEIDLPFYTVHFHEGGNHTVQSVAVLHKFSAHREIRSAFVSLDGLNWKKTSAVKQSGIDDQVPIDSAPRWAPNDTNFGLKFSEAGLSVTRDHGKSWSPLPQNEILQRPVKIRGLEEARAAHKAQGLPIYAAVTSWQKFIVHNIVFDHHEPGTVYMLSNQGILKSCDYGKSWTVLGVGTEMLFAVHSFAIHPTDSSHLMVGTTQGVYVSRDHGCTFSRVLSVAD